MLIRKITPIVHACAAGCEATVGDFPRGEAVKVSEEPGFLCL